MNKIFVLKGKYANYFMDFSTPESELEAYYTAFLINDSFGYYNEDEKVLGFKYSTLEKARSGNKVAAKRIILIRSVSEYEHFIIEELTNSQEWLNNG